MNMDGLEDVLIEKNRSKDRPGRVDYKIVGPSPGKVYEAISRLRDTGNVDFSEFMTPACIGASKYVSLGFVKERIYAVS